MYVSSLEGDPIAAIGTVYIDNTKYINATELTPGEYVSGEGSTRVGGSPAKFAESIKELEGNEVHFIGRVGDDPNGRAIERNLSKAGIYPLLEYDEHNVTNTATHLILPGPDNEIRIKEGSANEALTIEDIRDVFNIRDAEAIDYDCDPGDPKRISFSAIYLGGINKLNALHADLPDFAEEVRGKGIDLFVDHGRVNAETTAAAIFASRLVVKQSTVYLPSKDELLRVWDADSIESAVYKIRKVAQSPLIVLKMGELGSVAYLPDSVAPIYERPYLVSSTVRPVGAGDTYNAAFVNALRRGGDVIDALRSGNAAGAHRVRTSNAPNQQDLATIRTEPTKLVEYKQLALAG